MQRIMRRVKQRVQTANPNDYSRVLRGYQLPFKEHDEFLIVSKSDSEFPWVIHISIIYPQLKAFLKRLVPLLGNLKANFQIPRDIEVARKIIDGRMGEDKVAKVISIFPQNNEQALVIAKAIIPLTEEFKGPRIPGAALIGGKVFATNDRDTRNWPFGEIAPLRKFSASGFVRNYRIVYPLKRDVKGRVLYVIRWSWKFPFVQKCVIKEGREAMFSENETDDIQVRLQWQYELHTALQGKLPVPKAYELFKEENDLYLVMQYIKGAHLHSIVDAVHGKEVNTVLSRRPRLKILNILLKIVSIIKKLHELGYIHRDITPANFLVTKNGKIYLIDLELTYNTNNPGRKPFKGGTEGYTSLQQSQERTPTFYDDIYALGALMTKLLLNLSLSKTPLSTLQRVSKTLQSIGYSPTLASVIEKCLSTSVIHRPEIAEIHEALRIEIAVVQSARQIE